MEKRKIHKPYPNLPFGGDMTQMQQMMMLQQNGMSATAFGNFPMMGK
jgi:hypothetical protein